MHWTWRALVAGLLLGGTVLWVPTMTTDAATPLGAGSSAVRGPAADNEEADNDQDDNTEDNGESDNDNDTAGDNGNTNGNANDNDTAGDNGNTNGNANDNDSAPAPTATPVPGQPGPGTSQGHGEIVTNGDLQIELFRSRSDPAVNSPFEIGVIGSGTPIERIWWWAEAPGSNAGDDFGHAGEVSFTCGGAQPCAQNWTIIGRNVGWYTIHAKVRAVDGREVQTDWFFLVQSNG